MKQFKVLETVSLNAIENFSNNNIGRYDLDSPAVVTLTDFKNRKPLMLDSSTLVSSAIEMMRAAHVKLKMVVDKQEHFLGIVSYADLHGIKLGKASAQLGVPASELTIADVMISKDHLHGIYLHDVDHAKIGDIVNTLKHLGEQHVLVIEENGSSIRGLISAADISRLLHIKFDITETAHTFADVFQALKVS